MKRIIYILIGFLLITNVYSQCNTPCTTCSISSATACTYVVTSGSNETTNFTVNAGQKLCIQSGTYTGTVTMRTGTVVVGTGATFNGRLVGFFTASQGGTFEVHAGATASINNLISTNSSTFTLNNCGNLTMGGNLGTFNGVVNINNVGRMTSAFNYSNNTTGTTCNGGYMEYVNFNSANGSVINQDSLVVTGNTQTNSDNYTLCSGSVLQIQGTFASTNGNFTGFGACAYITVAGTSQCVGCDLYGTLDFCAVGAANPFSNPTFSSTATGTIASTVTQCTNCTLPIKWGSVNVNCKNGFNVITWLTYSEINNDYFSIEKSFDGKSFFSIGKVKGEQNSTKVLEYTYSDNEKGNAYYRLKQVDIDGEYDYSNVIYGDNCLKSRQVSIYPNPIQDKLFIKIDRINDLSVKIYNLLGQEMFSNEYLNMNYLSIDVNEFKKGIYIIKIDGGEVHYSQKIIMK